MCAWNVGIVGGGPGGLMTAYFLQKVSNIPVKITIFEASSRLGGKILTPRFESVATSYEAGAAEFYDYSPIDEDPLKDLVAELGLATRSMGGSSLIYRERLLTNLDDVRETLGAEEYEGLRRFDRFAKDQMTPREFFDSDDSPNPSLKGTDVRFDSFMAASASSVVRDYVQKFIHSDLATEPRHTSVAYGLQNYLMNDPAYMQLYCIEGGNEQLPAQLALRTEADYLLEHSVTAVQRGDDGTMIVNSVHRGESKQNHFDAVVIALPNNLLPKVQFVGERLRRAIDAHHAQYNHPAHYLRMTLLFSEPFWRTKLPDSYCMLDAFDGCCLYDESSRDPLAKNGILGWLLGGDQAEALSDRSDEELIQLALDSLPEFLADGKKYLLEGKVHRWIGAVNALPGGVHPHPLDRRHQPEPLEHPNLFMVGDYLFDSTLNGVLDSAEYVAYWIAALMEESRYKAKES